MNNKPLLIKVIVTRAAFSGGSLSATFHYGLIPILCAAFIAFHNLPAYSEIYWSPDGKWLSFRQEHNKSVSDIIRPGWLFHPESLTNVGARRDSISQNSVIWIGRSDRKIWHKVKETSSETLFLSQPAWSVDGRSLYYAAVRQNQNKQLVWQVLQISSLNDLQNAYLVWEKALPVGWKIPAPGSRQRRTISNFQAGPDNLLVFADPESDSLILYRSDSREIIARMPEGFNARISPSGEIVAWLRSDTWPARDAELMLTRSDDGSQSTHFRQVLPDSIPIFSVSSSEILIARHLPPPSGMNVPAGSNWPELCKVSLNSSRSRRFATVVPTPILPSEKLSGVSFTMNQDEDALIYSAAVSTRPSEIVWFLPKTSATHKRFPPLDLRTDSTCLAFSAEQQLALRFGTPEQTMENDGLTPAICDLGESPLIQPLAPDDANAKIWTLLLARCIAKTLNHDIASTGLSFTEAPQEHFFLAPNLAEFSGTNPVSNRLARFSRIGLDAIGLDPYRPGRLEIEKLSGWKLEAAALFLILTNHHDLAITALDHIDFQKFGPLERGRFFALKAQEHIEAGHEIEAQAMIESLILSDPRFLESFQPDGKGSFQITQLPESSWRKFLSNLKKASQNPPRESEGRSPINPFGHFNPDDPENDPDLRMQEPQPLMLDQ